LVENVPRDVWEDVPVWIPLLASYPVPNLRALKECMVDAYENPRRLRAKGREARKSALEYDWERVIPRWDALLREMVSDVWRSSSSSRTTGSTSASTSA